MNRASSCSWAHKSKGPALTQVLALISTGRRGGIRTRDPLHPMQVRYQAALHAESIIITLLAERSRYAMFKNNQGSLSSSRIS